jgi:hypothetical protein
MTISRWIENPQSTRFRANHRIDLTLITGSHEIPLLIRAPVHLFLSSLKKSAITRSQPRTEEQERLSPLIAAAVRRRNLEREEKREIKRLFG